MMKTRYILLGIICVFGLVLSILNGAIAKPVQNTPQKTLKKEELVTRTAIPFDGIIIEHAEIPKSMSDELIERVMKKIYGKKSGPVERPEALEYTRMVAKELNIKLK